MLTSSIIANGASDEIQSINKRPIPFLTLGVSSQPVGWVEHLRNPSCSPLVGFASLYPPYDYARFSSDVAMRSRISFVRRVSATCCS